MTAALLLQLGAPLLSEDCQSFAGPDMPQHVMELSCHLQVMVDFCKAIVQGRAQAKRMLLAAFHSMASARADSCKALLGKEAFLVPCPQPETDRCELIADCSFAVIDVLSL